MNTRKGQAHNNIYATRLSSDDWRLTGRAAREEWERANTLKTPQFDRSVDGTCCGVDKAFHNKILVLWVLLHTSRKLGTCRQQVLRLQLPDTPWHLQLTRMFLLRIWKQKRNIGWGFWFCGIILAVSGSGQINGICFGVNFHFPIIIDSFTIRAGPLSRLSW